MSALHHQTSGYPFRRQGKPCPVPMTSLSKITGQEGTTLALSAGEGRDIKAWTLLAVLQPQPHSRVMKRGSFVIGHGLAMNSP